MTRPTAREENPGSARDYSRIETLNRIYKRNDGIYASACQRMHLPASVFDVLYALCITDGLTQKEICDACFCSKQTIHSAVARLQKEGSLRAERGAGRSVRLFLTPEGRALADRTVAPVIEAERASLATLSDASFALLARTAQALNDDLAARIEAIPF